MFPWVEKSITESVRRGAGMCRRARGERYEVEGTTRVSRSASLALLHLGRKERIVNISDGGLRIRATQVYPPLTVVHGRALVQLSGRTVRFIWKGIVIWVKSGGGGPDAELGICLTKKLECLPPQT